MWTFDGCRPEVAKEERAFEALARQQKGTIILTTPIDDLCFLDVARLQLTKLKDELALMKAAQLRHVHQILLHE